MFDYPFRAVLKFEESSRQGRKTGPLNPLSPGIKLQILLLCFHTFLTKVVGRSC